MSKGEDVARYYAEQIKPSGDPTWAAAAATIDWSGQYEECGAELLKTAVDRFRAVNKNTEEKFRWQAHRFFRSRLEIQTYLMSNYRAPSKPRVKKNWGANNPYTQEDIRERGMPVSEEQIRKGVEDYKKRNLEP